MNFNPFASNIASSFPSVEWLPFTGRALTANLFNTLLLLLAALAGRWLIQRLIIRQQLPVETRRRIAVTLRNGMLLVIVAGVVLIWARELQPFAISLFAIAVAFVIATKGFWQCLTGNFVRAGSNVVSVGRRIEVKGMRGDVIDHNLFHTTILEIGPGNASHQYTGRTILLPNSVFLENAVVSDNYTGRYIVQIISVPLAKGEDWVRAESLLLKIANQECGGYLADARRALEALETKNWIEVPSAEPRVTVKLREPNEVTLQLRVPAPARRQRAIEQRILQRFLRIFYAGGEESPLNEFTQEPANESTSAPMPAITPAHSLPDLGPTLITISSNPNIPQQ